MSKYIDVKHFEGKTIKKVNELGVNCIRFEFTDNTYTELEVEYFGGIYGMIENYQEDKE